MRLNKWMLLGLLLTLGACQSLTIPPIATVDSVPSKATGAAAPRFILCSQDPYISYSAPKPGQQEDRANAFDTPETIGADAPAKPAPGTIRYHNEVGIAACGASYVPK